MLTDDLARQGDWLFRYRSYVPLLLLPAAVLALVLNRDSLFGSSAAHGWYSVACLAVSLAGVGIRAMAVGWARPGSSGRNTKQQVADHLNTDGLYSVCRHPLYLGNTVIAFGVMMFTRSALFTLAGVLVYALFYERIAAAEERFLAEKYGDTFREWARKTPAFLPRWSLWRKPAHRFSLKAAVKGEFYALTALLLVMFVLRTLDIRFAERAWRLDVAWAIPAAGMLVLFVILRHLRKHTRFFEEGGSAVA